MKSAYEAGAEMCPQRIATDLERRPANALNVEIGQPLPRCRCLTPDEWGAEDIRATRWLLSGGSPLVLGVCCADSCPLPAHMDAQEKV